MAGLICWNCGKSTDIEGRLMRSDNCPHCLADLRCCRGCRFFDPTSRWQCRETIDGPETNKEKANLCDHFQARLAVHAAGRRMDETTSKAEKKKKFDDLFKD
jgi:hypothetical protein